jgi:3-dehydroquinate synthase
LAPVSTAAAPSAAAEAASSTPNEYGSLTTQQQQPDAGATVNVAVPAGPPASYDVVIRAGALADIPSLVARAAPAARYALIAPAPVAGLHARPVLDAMRDAGLAIDLFEFDDGEAHKTRATWAHLTDALLDAGFGRDCCVIALGGGVTGDLAGFVAATYMRGVPIVQVPTTLLAMIDASVGGKTGVDTAAGKNLVGAFHQPRLVVMDPAVLRTLPDEQLRAGLAEAVKHGAILDADYFAWIEEHAEALRAGDVEALTRLVARSVQIKAEVTAQDPHERGRRAILNFGHTVGHALESVSGFTLLHGFAVALGMLAEAEVGERLQITAAGTRDRLDALLYRCGLPVRQPAVDMDAVSRALRFDKKARAGELRLPLLEDIGACAGAADSWTHTVPDSVLRTAIQHLVHTAGRV